MFCVVVAGGKPVEYWNDHRCQKRALGETVPEIEQQLRAFQAHDRHHGGGDHHQHANRAAGAAYDVKTGGEHDKGQHHHQHGCCAGQFDQKRHRPDHGDENRRRANSQRWVEPLALCRQQADGQGHDQGRKHRFDPLHRHKADHAQQRQPDGEPRIVLTAQHVGLRNIID